MAHKPFIKHRSSITGKAVSKLFAERNPDTTQTNSPEDQAECEKMMETHGPDEAYLYHLLEGVRSAETCDIAEWALEAHNAIGEIVAREYAARMSGEKPL